MYLGFMSRSNASLVDAGDRGAAYSSQNLAPGGFVAAHLGHFAAKGVAHSLQNFAPSRLSAPHFVHRTLPALAI